MCMLHDENFLTKIFYSIDFTYRYKGHYVRKPVFGGFVNKKGADQPAHPCSLIRTFVVRLLEIII